MLQTKTWNIREFPHLAKQTARLGHSKSGLLYEGGIRVNFAGGALQVMTLLDAPTYDPAKSRKRKNILITSLVTVLVLAGLLWYFWNWPQEHRVNQFFAAVEAKDLPKAFSIWNHDPDWQRHPQKYTQYSYGRFEVDWGHSSDWGDIKTHKIVMSKTVGSGVVVGVEVNGQRTPVFLWVQRSDKTIGFSPVQLSTD